MPRDCLMPRDDRSDAVAMGFADQIGHESDLIALPRPTDRLHGIDLLDAARRTDARQRCAVPIQLAGLAGLPPT
jgi:hypothetical protein